MTSEQLADAVESAIGACRARVLGVGADQYDDGSGVQKFETLPAAELASWLLEEADDLIVYAVMLRIRAAPTDRRRSFLPLRHGMRTRGIPVVAVHGAAPTGYGVWLQTLQARYEDGARREEVLRRGTSELTEQ